MSAVEHEVERLSCGCLLRFDDDRGLIFFTPCSENHRAVAQRVRAAYKPSRLIVCRPLDREVES